MSDPDRCPVLASDAPSTPAVGEGPCVGCRRPALRAESPELVYRGRPDDEGVIKFRLEHESTSESSVRPAHAFEELRHWRERLHQLRLIGQEADRYGGVGYGNASCRVPPYVDTPNRKPFLVTGTQTGATGRLAGHGYALVTGYYPAENRLVSQGPIRPSAESLTHGMIYDLFPWARWVFHAHCPEIWRASPRLGIPVTDPDVPYGTPEMAQAVARLRDSVGLPDQILAMGGHEDGVITFGRTAEEAGHVLVRTLSLAKSLPCPPGRRP